MAPTKNSAAEIWRRLRSSVSFSALVRGPGLRAGSNRARTLSSWLRDDEIRAPACSYRRRVAASELKWRARWTAAVPVAGLRIACGAGPRTLFGTVPPPDVHNLGDDYVPILAR